MTVSPLAVSGLYIIKPLATLSTNFWAGSFIDRLNKRKLMVFLDIFRAVFIALLPFMSSISPNLFNCIYHKYGEFNICSDINDLYYKINSSRTKKTI